MKKLYFLLFLITPLLADAQSPGDIAQSYGSMPGFSNTGRAVTQQTDGKLLVGGNFTSYNGENENYIIRLNTDGTKDTSFDTGTGFSNQVRVITTQTDGKILVGGHFSAYNETTVNRIVRLNADGTKDNTFNTGTGFNLIVYTVALQADGKILVGGNFTTYNGLTENYIIRLNSDGTKDNSFNTGNGFNNIVYTIIPQVDGKILVGGNFTSYKGITENYIIRLNSDGTKDATFSLGSGFNGTVSTMAVQADGKVVVGGNFTYYNGTVENRIIRLNIDGTKDISFNTGSGFGSWVRSILPHADGKILIGGEFITYNGVPAKCLIRLTNDGLHDTDFITGTGTGSTGGVMAITSITDGKILMVGGFTYYNGASANRIIRLNTNGTKDNSFNAETGFNSTVSSIKLQADDKILVGGFFTSYKGTIENQLLRLNTDGTKDTTFTTGIGFDSEVQIIAPQPDGKIVVGGSFESYNNIIAKSIIRLNNNGTKDLTFNTGTGFNSSVWSIQPKVDNKILVGGSFTLYNGAVENRIIRLNSDGSKDISFNTGTGFDSATRTIESQTDGKILVGGNFTSYNGVSENHIIRLNLDGTKDTAFNTGTGFNNTVWSIAIQTDGKILVGGEFTSYKGITENNIIRLNSNGTKDTSFNTGIGFNGAIYTITPQPDGKIMVGGYFTSYNGTIENNIIRLNSDGSKDTTFNTGTGFNEYWSFVFAITPPTNGKVHIGGQFNSYNGNNNSAHLIALHTENSLGTTNLNDSNSIIIYPNPVSDVLYIESNELNSIKALKIFDLQGKLILKGTNKTINVSNLKNGLYIIKILTAEGEFVKKFIKK
jgi:uncharacterized delta-60 repeat protein